MTSRKPFILTPQDLLAAEVRLFQADVDLALRSANAVTSAWYWPAGHGIPPAPVVLPEGDQGDSPKP